MISLKLSEGTDFRRPEYRREVFLRFYEFHLKYRAHPGAVYYLFDWLSERHGLDFEERLWLAFINGCSQNLVTSWLIFQQAPTLEAALSPSFNEWFRLHYNKLGWDVDRRYVKNQLIRCFESYKQNLAGRTQVEFFTSMYGKNSKATFDTIWDHVMGHFYLFGRLATFSYLEYLRIVGVDLECSQLFLDDISGSKSHRNGLAIVSGRDDWDWRKDQFVKYTQDMIDFLEGFSEGLLSDAQKRFPGEHVHRFTLESTLCCYKSWHRKNRRYPNVYNDMFCARIRYAEKKWGRSDLFQTFWDARRHYLPAYLRLEDNPRDPGIDKIKQNHYRETGEIPMMDFDWSCFNNSFNERYYGDRKSERNQRVG